ncbi:MAG: amino acid ABC transporter permease [Acidimicrobiia bacterium]|nr:amino acid ABC transporter permease [Acidimicrobiia bacterium]
MQTFLTEDLAVPPPEPPRPPTAGPADWVRRNLFRSVGDGVVTVVAAIVVGFVVFRFARFLFSTGRWEIVRTNLKLFMVGRYPADELWRIVVALTAVAFVGGLIAGFVARRHVVAGTVAPDQPVTRRLVALVGRLWPLVVGVLLLLFLSSSPGPWLTAAAIVVAAVLGRLAGPYLPRRSAVVLVLGSIVLAAALVWFLTRPVGWDRWGGIMLNLFLATAGITLCFPLGVLLALGRRSKLPLIRAVCIAYIELFRGVPLFVLLLLSAIALGFFIPTWLEPPGLVVRAIVVFTLFTAAYVAEIVRGGLQSLPKGQTEAAQALGLSPVKTTFLIVMPQALRNVIPALVGQFISLFKDTTLAGAAMGFLDALQVANAATAQDAFRGQRLLAESLGFVMLLFWIGCITMSRESQRLERTLGVGTR